VYSTKEFPGLRASTDLTKVRSHWHLTGRAGKSFIETIEQNPLVVAGVGLLVGGLIASALPRSDIEDGFDPIGDQHIRVSKQTGCDLRRGQEDNEPVRPTTE